MDDGELILDEFASLISRDAELLVDRWRRQAGSAAPGAPGVRELLGRISEAVRLGRFDPLAGDSVRGLGEGVAGLCHLRTAVLEHLERAAGVPVPRPVHRLVDEVLDDSVARRLSEYEERRKLELEEGHRMIGEFLATVIHELRNPVGACRYALELLKLPGCSTERTEAMLGVLERQVDHLGRTEDDLLDLSRLLLGEFQIEEKVFDLRAPIERSLRAAAPGMEAKGLDVSTAFPDEPVWVRGDVHRIEQVVDNLLGNAAKFTDPPGRVTVEAKARGSRAVIRVADTGRGIDRDRLPFLFERFRQGGPRTGGGLGIGLFLVRRLVEAHGGEVEASSEGPGRGSEFVARLPRARRPGRGSAVPGRPQVVPAGELVLVVDNDPDWAELLRGILEPQGYLVRWAVCEREALQAVRISAPRIVLLDLELAGSRGIEVGRTLKRGFPGLTVIAYSAHVDERVAEEIREAGLDGAVSKTAPIEDLLGALGERARRVAT